MCHLAGPSGRVLTRIHRRSAMRRIAIFGFGVLAMVAGAFAQTPDTDTPLLALPANLRADAGVVKWKPDHTYDTLKPSKNGLVCYDRSGFPLQAAFSMECSAEANLPRVKQNMEAEALGDKMKSEAKLMEEEKAGTRVKPVYGSVWYHLMGPKKEGARTHMTIAGPGDTMATTGPPANARRDTVWLL